MPATSVFSLYGDLRRISQQLVELACPSCEQHDPQLIWRRDRYFLNVNLSVCRRCALVYLARGLQGEAQSEFYTHIYPRLMKQPSPPGALWNNRLFAGYRYSEITAVVGPLKSVVDIGSGLGFFLDACRNHGCSQYLGLEPGGPQREHAIHVLGLGDNVLAQGLDGDTRLPFKPQVVTLFHVLEHLQDPGKSLQRIAGLIDPQGWLVIEVPDISAAWRGLGLQQIHISHRSYFSPQTLEALLRNNGFTVQRTCREPSGIYEGNLRVYARPGSAKITDPPPDAQHLNELSAHILTQIRPLSLRNGYPRAALRLAVLSLQNR